MHNNPEIIEKSLKMLIHAPQSEGKTTPLSKLLSLSYNYTIILHVYFNICIDEKGTLVWT